MALQSAPALDPIRSIPIWKQRLPMALTWSRMAVCPVFIVLVIVDGPIWGWLAAGLFIMASITDWFDGYLARKFHATSNLGKFMDPIADKILVATVLILLVALQRIGPVVVILLLARDIFIGGIRSVAAADNLIIDAKATGKWKTGLQMVAIPALLIHTPVLDIPVAMLGTTLLWVSVVLSTISGYQYVKLYMDSRIKKLNQQTDIRRNTPPRN
jgi:CDP-diacylglycerol--glycerol-3-phosphate 3-phosphatidyltransferase